MAATYTYQIGDSIVTDMLQILIFIPDANGGNSIINGSVYPVGGSQVNVQSIIALPAAPGSGSIYFIIEVNHSTGAVDLQQSTSAFPSANANCDIVFQDILTPATTDPAQDPNNTDF